ncbi:MAG TPA: LysR substrate-binding domain-containing protein [Acetobacteraceae bacterium]|nr:LysR substrate-binding domain-containing protein [Acetobacteraceae bacterium]
MHRSLLPHFPVVLAVARRRSFVGAANELGMGASAVSHAVRTVEDGLGIPLFTRTTRSVAPTEAGAAVLAVLDRTFGEIEAALERVAADRGAVTGLLRLNAPRVALPIALTPILALLARRHPALTVDVTSDDALTDIVAEGFDAGIRLGEMIEQDMVAARLTPPFAAIMVAAPAYLAARGRPDSIAALRAHNCIGFRLLAAQRLYAWELRQDGADVAVAVRGSVIVTDPVYARELALAGIGIAYLFEPLVHADLQAGRLCQVLPEAALTEPGLFLYFPRRSAGTPKLRAFLDAARAVRRQAPATP